MPASRSRPPLGLVVLTLLSLVACGVAVWRTSSSARRQATAVRWAAPPAPDAAPPLADPTADAGLAAAPEPPPEPVFPPFSAQPGDLEPLAVPLVNPERLDHFFGKLTRSELGLAGAVTRASHWGDSVIGGDGLTEAIRRKLQLRFGDAGHGFHIMGKYNRWYNHRGVRYEERREWDTCLVIFKCRPDMRYGYGGVVSSSRGKAQSRFRTAAPGGGDEVIGDKASRFQLFYQKRPDGGGFELRVDGKVAKVVDARAAELSDDVETLDVPDGEHAFEVTAIGAGVARAYGVVLERDVPGVVWDELSLIGSFTQRLDYQDAEHLMGQVRRRDVDLMVFMFGGNDLSREKTDLRHTTEPYEREYARVIRKFRAGKPEASCLIMSLTDHAERVGGAIVSRHIVARLAQAQRRVAESEGCAFYDTFTAMGGPGTIARWRAASPPLASPDLRHPTVAGQRHIAADLYRKLMHAYAAYRQRQEGKPLP